MLNWNEYRDQVNAAVKELSKANPDIVRAHAGLNAANAKSTRIDVKTRELIALAVAVTLRCDGRRSAEIKNDESARDRARLLAGSSYPLRSLHRMAEAKTRIDAAFDLLRTMKAWPALSIRPGEEAGFAMRAVADYYQSDHK